MEHHIGQQQLDGASMLVAPLHRHAMATAVASPIVGQVCLVAVHMNAGHRRCHCNTGLWYN